MMYPKLILIPLESNILPLKSTILSRLRFQRIKYPGLAYSIPKSHSYPILALFKNRYIFVV
jgi:hypothetical protein